MPLEHEESDDQVRRTLEEASKGVERFLTPWPDAKPTHTRFSDFPIGIDDEGRPFERKRKAAHEDERTPERHGRES